MQLHILVDSVLTVPSIGKLLADLALAGETAYPTDILRPNISDESFPPSSFCIRAGELQRNSMTEKTRVCISIHGALLQLGGTTA